MTSALRCGFHSSTRTQREMEKRVDFTQVNEKQGRHITRLGKKYIGSPIEERCMLYRYLLLT